MLRASATAFALTIRCGGAGGDGGGWAEPPRKLAQPAGLPRRTLEDRSGATAFGEVLRLPITELDEPWSGLCHDIGTAIADELEFTILLAAGCAVTDEEIEGVAREGAERPPLDAVATVQGAKASSKADIGADFKRRGPGGPWCPPLWCTRGDWPALWGTPKYGEESSRGTTRGDGTTIGVPTCSRGEPLPSM